MNLVSKKVIFRISVIAFSFVFLSQIQAQTDYTSAAPGGDWETATSWAPNGNPGAVAGDTATVDTGSTITRSSAFTVGTAGVTTVTISGGVLDHTATTGNPIDILDGAMVMTDGELIMRRRLRIGSGPNANGSFRMSGGAVNLINLSNSPTIGDQAGAGQPATGELIIDGGTFSISANSSNQNIIIGAFGDSATTKTGTMTVNGGSFVTNTDLRVTRGPVSEGTLNINGGLVDIGNDLQLGNSDTDANPSVAVVNLTSGVLKVRDAVFRAELTDLTFNWTGGTFEPTNAVRLGVTSDSFTLNNQGGTLSPGGFGVAEVFTFTAKNGDPSAVTNYTQNSSSTLLFDLENGGASDVMFATSATITLDGTLSVNLIGSALPGVTEWVVAQATGGTVVDNGLVLDAPVVPEGTWTLSVTSNRVIVTLETPLGLPTTAVENKSWQIYR